MADEKKPAAPVSEPVYPKNPPYHPVRTSPHVEPAKPGWEKETVKGPGFTGPRPKDPKNPPDW